MYVYITWQILATFKVPLSPKDDMTEFDVRDDANKLEKNLQLQVCPNDSKDKVLR